MRKILAFVAIVVMALVASSAYAAELAYRYDGSVANRRGDVIGGAFVHVYAAGTDSLAGIYDSADTSTAVVLSNPTFTDSYGRYHFYILPGWYDIHISGAGISGYEFYDIYVGNNYVSVNADSIAVHRLAINDMDSLIAYNTDVLIAYNRAKVDTIFSRADSLITQVGLNDASLDSISDRYDAGSIYFANAPDAPDTIVFSAAGLDSNVSNGTAGWTSTYLSDFTVYGDSKLQAADTGIYLITADLEYSASDTSTYRMSITVENLPLAGGTRYIDIPVVGQHFSTSITCADTLISGNKVGIGIHAYSDGTDLIVHSATLTVSRIY